MHTAGGKATTGEGITNQHGLDWRWDGGVSVSQKEVTPNGSILVVRVKSYHTVVTYTPLERVSI